MREIGRFRILGQAGRGGMGLVLRAVAPDGRPVAIKLLLAGAGAPGAARARFQREAQALMRLDHPHVVRLLDCGEAQGAPWLALQWVEGETLEQRLARAGPLAPEPAAALVARLAWALSHCHAQGVVHRDLKPANVLLRASDGLPLLTDFGLARDLLGDEPGGARLTRTGAYLGTPGYWSPEQALGRSDQVGPRSDVFGLGALLFALLTGQAPFAGESYEQLLQALERPAPRPGALRAGVPAWLDAICARCLALDPAQRFDSAGDLALALERSAGGASGEPASAVRARRPALVAPVLVAPVLVAPVLVGLVAAGAVSLALLGRQRPAGGAPAPEISSLAAPGSRAGPAASSAPEPAALLTQARRAWRRHDLTSARALAERFMTACPARRADGLLVVAQALWVEGDRAASLRAAEEALRCATDDAQRRLARIVAAAAENDAPRARALTSDVLAVTPDDVDVRADLLFWAATALEGEGDRLAAMDRVLALDPEFGRALYNRSLLRGGAGDVQGALRDVTRLLELAPHLAAAWNNRAVWRWQTGDLPGSIADFTRAIELQPDDPKTWTGRASSREGLGDLAGAEEDASHALALDPRHGPAWRARGQCRLAAGRLAEAQADYEQALQLDPADAGALGGRGLSRARSGDASGARADYDRSLQLNPRDAQVWFFRGKLRLGQGDAQGALADCSRALELAPRDARPLLVRARALRQLGRRDEALADLQALVLATPRDTEAWFELGLTHKLGGDLEGALAHYAHAARLAPGDHGPWIWQGNTRFDLGDFAGAEADFSRAIELAPDEAEAWNGRGKARIRLSSLPGALTDLDRAVALDPASAARYCDRAVALALAGELLRARADCDRALELDPHLALAWLQRAMIRERQGDGAGALEDAEAGLAEPSATPFLREQLALVRERLLAAMR